MDIWKFYSALPTFLQSLLITIYNNRQYNMRYRDDFSFFLHYYSRAWSFDEQSWRIEQRRRLAQFLGFATRNSVWYQDFKGLALEEFPVLEKKQLIEDLRKVATIKEKDAIISHTGGTTGASMKVLYTKRDTQERFAVLGSFRKKYGYELGSKVAWFSGKNLATDKDVENGHCYRDDYVNNIRFFSTFHISEKNFYSYWRAIQSFSPDFIVGFPSSVYELSAIAVKKGMSLDHKVKTFFPTAEVVLPQYREVISAAMGCRLVDQYSSSEGAPFIFECENGFYHIHPLTGIIEVVDENLKPAREGEMLVTSFTTHGTPLIRYRIGDRIKLADENFSCPCGSTFPVVSRIEGRSNDFIYSPDNGRINLGNLSNSTKGVEGIVCFQIVQKVESSVTVYLVTLPSYNSKSHSKFLLALRERLGQSMHIEFCQVDDIPRETSGKFRIVKSYL